jgi:ABC-type antimicrobial peptide transport system permease subunit
MATIGASLLVSSSQQLRERRRMYASLTALGVQRSTLAWALLLDNLVPVLLGVVLAIGAGTGLGALLLYVVDAPAQVNLATAATTAGLAGAVVLAVSALGLAELRHATSPEGLRSE